MFQRRADNNPHLAKNYRKFLIDKAKLMSEERKCKNE